MMYLGLRNALVAAIAGLSAGRQHSTTTHCPARHGLRPPGRETCEPAGYTTPTCEESRRIVNPINTMLERAIALDIEWQRNPLNHASTLNKATMVYSQLRF